MHITWQQRKELKIKGQKDLNQEHTNTLIRILHV